MILASARVQVGEFLSALIYVYILLIFAYIVIQMLFSAGLRPPYTITTNRVLSFLHDVCEPFLRIFRRLGLRFGPLDLSPTVAIFTLLIINSVVVHGIIE